jgi:hypothetical protein
LFLFGFLVWFSFVVWVWGAGLVHTVFIDDMLGWCDVSVGYVGVLFLCRWFF